MWNSFLKFPAFILLKKRFPATSVAERQISVIKGTRNLVFFKKMKAGHLETQVGAEKLLNLEHKIVSSK